MPNPMMKKVFIFLDTDRHASPFDILTVIDAVPGVSVIKYENVAEEDGERIIYDALFPRGPEGSKHTKIFITGGNFELAERLFEKAKKCMQPPFEMSVIIDPRGAYTTSSALVAKTLEIMSMKKLGVFKGKTVTILAGTGPVGQTAARLCATEGANVIITSRDLQKSSGVANRINQELGKSNVQGTELKSPEETGRVIEKADIILLTGAAGVRLLTAKTLKEHGKRCRIVADINAIPPLGMENLSSDANGQEFVPGVFGIGALSIGKLKSSVEVAVIRKAAEEPHGFFDEKIAFDLAKRTSLARLIKVKKSHQTESPKLWLP